MSATDTMAAAPAVAPRRPAYAWLWVSVIVVVLDYATKVAIGSAFRVGEEKVITSFFSLVLTYNPGAAFSFLAGAGGWQRWFFAAVAAGATVVIALLLRRGGDRWYCLGLALILGGALGNLWDRLTIGAVVDFLLFHYRGWYWPAFNVADSAITVGAALLILDGFRMRHTRSDVGRERVAAEEGKDS